MVQLNPLQSVMRLSAAQTKLAIGDSLSQLHRRVVQTGAVPERRSPLHLGKRVREVLDPGDVIRALEVLAQDPYMDGPTFVAKMAQFGSTASRSDLYSFRKSRSRFFQVPVELHKFISDRSHRMPQEARKIEDEMKVAGESKDESHFAVFGRAHQTLAVWYNYCIVPQMNAPETGPCVGFSQQGRAVMKLSEAQARRCYSDLLHQARADMGLPFQALTTTSAPLEVYEAPPRNSKRRRIHKGKANGNPRAGESHSSWPQGWVCQKLDFAPRAPSQCAADRGSRKRGGLNAQDTICALELLTKEPYMTGGTYLTEMARLGSTAHRHNITDFRGRKSQFIHINVELHDFMLERAHLMPDRASELDAELKTATETNPLLSIQGSRHQTIAVWYHYHSSRQIVDPLVPARGSTEV